LESPISYTPTEFDIPALNYTHEKSYSKSGGASTAMRRLTFSAVPHSSLSMQKLVLRAGLYVMVGVMEKHLYLYIRSVILALALFINSPSLAASITDGEITASEEQKQSEKPVTAKEWMISAANPHAVRAGADVLAQGGSAADAMVAAQSVLGLVEPQSSGLGGGAFLIWYDAASGKITTLDGRETASRHVTPELFLDEAGEPLKFFDAVVGGRSVGTPGTPALMAEAHRRWGRLTWPILFNRGIELARSGFEVSPRLAKLVIDDRERLSRYQRASDYFYPGGIAVRAGHLLKNEDYAETLESLAGDNGLSFYRGEIARDIARTAQSAEDNPGLLDTSDLAQYTVIERPPVCAAYRGFDVCGMGPPSSGGLTVGQILGLIAPYDIAGMGPNSPAALRLIGDASRLAFADRGRYMADSDFVPVPSEGLLNANYLKSRSELLKGGRALEAVEPGVPPAGDALHLADDDSIELPSTSHISIVDQFGNALSMTTTIENAFGSRLMTEGGFLLNNEMTDFSFTPQSDGNPVANRVEPGKRPRSSMAPTIILKDGSPVLVIGSPGGSRIIGYVAKAIIAHIDWGMDIQEAVTMPHFVNRFGEFDLEAETEAEDLAGSLSALGYGVKTRELNSGLHAIAISEQGLSGGADPRREGIALGR
jgi:gamma-glutamyltranspeptidase/glutathione hydrolase